MKLIAKLLMQSMQSIAGFSRSDERVNVKSFYTPCKSNNISVPLSQKKRKKGAPVRPGRICRILDEVKIDCLKEENADTALLKFWE